MTPICRGLRSPPARLGILALTVLLVRAAEPVAKPPETLAALREQVRAHTAQPRFARAQWGVHVVSLATGRTLVSVHPDQSFLPASTTKLFTGALALDRLGPDFRIRTSLHAAAPPDARGTLRGDLVVFGRGDPGFQGAAAGGDWDRVFAPLVAAVRRAGVRQVRGNLVADESFFRGPAIGSGWEYDDLPWYYGTGVSALSLNDNAIELVVRPAARVGLPAEVFLFPSTRHVAVRNDTRTVAAGGARTLAVARAAEANQITARGTLPLDARNVTESLAVRDPARWFGDEFKGALERAGIAVHGRVVVRPAAAADPGTLPGTGAPEAVELGSCESAPLRELLPRMLKPSQNLHAQLWLLQAGAAGAGVDGETSEQAGLRALNAFLDRAGITREEARFAEGSGLSRHNLVTPRALVRLLEYMTRHPHGALFRECLPVAGVDGTLRARMRGTPAEGNVRAKTGTLSLVYTLAGHVTTAAGEPLVFALMLNNYAGATADRPGRLELDDLAVLLAGLRQSTRDVPE
jgi:D-alanyl-D-alanine carboxypeptidase/D-alanyl-D-alanine-endopeptidase (penicillin-binding protein 4)